MRLRIQKATYALLVTVGAALALLMISGCGTRSGSETQSTPDGTESPGQTPPPGDNGLVDRLENEIGTRDDSVMLEISKRIPEWGGYYVGDDGVHVFMVNAPDVDEATKAALATELSGRVLNNAVAAENIIVEPARYSMLQLLEWFWLTDFRTTMFDVPGVTSIAVYERENGLFIGLESREYESDVLSKIAEFGISTDAAHFFVSGPVNLSP